MHLFSMFYLLCVVAGSHSAFIRSVSYTGHCNALGVNAMLCFSASNKIVICILYCMIIKTKNKQTKTEVGLNGIFQKLEKGFKVFNCSV